MACALSSVNVHGLGSCVSLSPPQPPALSSRPAPWSLPLINPHPFLLSASCTAPPAPPCWPCLAQRGAAP
eukprot:342165-Chlamydomonas_euryale.AAC.1